MQSHENKLQSIRENRKELVKAIGEIVEVKPKYLGMPSAAYQIDYFTITKEGTLEFDNRADSKEIESLLESLAEKGFTTENADSADNEPTTTDCPAQGETVGLAIEMPIDCVKIGNLTALLNAKGTLIKKALGVDNLQIEVKEDRVSFPWFGELDADTAKAYTHFISELCRMTVKNKRINAAEKPIENEKYAFRCFLLRLGFIGSEFKNERRILLKNLTGSSAFKGGAKS